MTKTRSELRNIAMIILYQIDIYEDRKVPFEIDEVIKANLEVDNEFVKDIVYGVTTYKNTLDEIANKYIDGWTIDRISYSLRKAVILNPFAFLSSLVKPSND